MLLGQKPEASQETPKSLLRAPARQTATEEQGSPGPVCLQPPRPGGRRGSDEQMVTLSQLQGCGKTSSHCELESTALSSVAERCLSMQFTWELVFACSPSDVSLPVACLAQALGPHPRFRMRFQVLTETRRGGFPLIKVKSFSPVILRTWEAVGRVGLANKLLHQCLFMADFFYSELSCLKLREGKHILKHKAT